MRVGAWLLATVFFVAALPSPTASGTLATPPAFGFEDVHSFFENSQLTLMEVAWHPSGAYALIAGGGRGPATDPARGYQVLLRYDHASGKVTPIVNTSGVPMLFAVRFAPDGSHALAVGEKDSVLRYDTKTGEVRNLFKEFQDQVLEKTANGEQPIFHGRGLAYNPTGHYAVITGQEMMFYNDTLGFFSPAGSTIKPAGGGYYKSIGFALDGSYAIVEGGDTYPEDDPNGWGGSARLGQLWFMGLTTDRCARFYDHGQAFCIVKFAHPYGQLSPDIADPAGITFHPFINTSYVYGYDDTHGTLMRIIDNGTYPAEKQPQADYVPQWMNAAHRGGKYTDMDFRPGSPRALMTAFGEPQILEFDSRGVRPLLDETICRTTLGHKCVSYESVAWRPDGAYALAVGLYGSILKVTPKPYPELEITMPTDSETFVAKGETNVLVQGSAYASVVGTKIGSVKVAADGGAWQDAKVLTKSNPARWSYTWNATGATPGPHTLSVFAEDTEGHVSPTLDLTVYLALPPPQLAAPVFENGNLTSRLGDFVVKWAPVEGASSYELQDSRDPAFLIKATWPADVPSFESFSRDNGTYYFRVRALGEPRPASDWSATISVDVTEGRRPTPAPTGDNDTPPASVPDTPPLDLPGADGNDTPPSTDGPDGDGTDGDGDEPPTSAEGPIPGAGWVAVVAALGVAIAIRRRR